MTPSKSQTSDRPRFQRAKQLLILVLIFADLLVMTMAYLNYRDRQRVATLLADLDRDDPGWRWEQMAASRRQLSDDKNGANVVLKSFGLMPESWPSRTFLESFNAKGYEDLSVQPAAKLDEPRVVLLRAEMAAVGPALNEARRLAQFPSIQFPLEPIRDPWGTPPRQAGLGRVAVLLHYDVLLRLEEGDADSALASAHALLNIVRSNADESALVSFLQGLTRRNGAIHQIERILAQGQATEASLAEIQALLMQDEVEPRLRNAIRGARAKSDLFCQAVDQGQVPEREVNGLLEAPKSLVNTGWDRLNEALRSWTGKSSISIATIRMALLEFHGQVIAIADEPCHLHAAQFRKLIAGQARLPFLENSLVPRYERVMQDYSENQAEMRCAIAAVAAERFRLAHGRWPETLAELIPKFLPQVPLDPFDGAPLRYRNTKDGVLIYAVGWNGKDKGGMIDRTNLLGTLGTEMGFYLFDVTKRRQPPVPKKAVVEQP